MKQFKLILFALSFLVLTRVYQQIESVNLPVSSVFRVTDSKFSNIIDANFISDSKDVSSFSNHTLIRSKRAAQEDFSSMVDNLSVSARLITAISLQNGLIDQSISADKALAELLNIGSVDLEQLEKFDKVKVDGFVTSLATLAPQLTAPKAKVEETVLVLDSWAKRFSEVGDLTDMSAVKKYFAEIDKLKSTAFDVSFIKKTITAIEAVVPSVEGIKGLPDNTRKNRGQNTVLAGQLITMHSNLEVVNAFSVKLSALSAVLDQFKPLTSLDFRFTSPQCKFLDFLENFYLTEPLVRPISPTDGTGLVDAITQMTSLDSGTSEADIQTLKAIMGLRNTGNLDYTNGFLEGAADLQRLDSDSQNQWFGTMIQGYKLDKLASGFGLLKDLGKKLTALQDNWKTLSTPQQQESVQQILKIQGKLKAAKSVDAKGSVTKIDSILAKRPNGHLGFADDAKNVYQKATHLTNTVNSVTLLVQSLSGSDVMKGLADIDQLTKSSKFPEDSNLQPAALPDIIDKIKAIKDTGALAENLNKLKPLLEGIDRKLGTQDLNAIVQELLTGESTMTAFQSNPTTLSFTAFFKSIIDSASDVESMKTAVQLHREVRKLPSGIGQDVQTVTSTFSNTLSGIKDARGTVDSIKSSGVAELKDLGKDSKTFGDSVKALDNVRKVLGKKAELEKFLEDSDAVEAEIVKVTDPSARREMLDDWGDFESIKRQVLELLIDLEARRDRIQAVRTKRGAPGFSDYQAVFAEFQGLPDVNLDTEKMQKVLTTLGPASQTMKDLKTSLDSLGSLNLKFANYNGPLGQIAATLANLQKTFSKKGGGGGSDGSEGSTGTDHSGSSAYSAASSAPDFLSTTTGTIVVISVIILIAFSLGAINMYCIFVKYKVKKKKKKSAK